MSPMLIGKADNSPKLLCSVRLDWKSEEPRGATSTGPPLMNVRWRRTIDYHTGDVIWDGPIISEHEIEERHHFSKAGGPGGTITELWHRGARAAPTFASYDDGIHNIELGWDGSPDTFFTSPAGKAYARVGRGNWRPHQPTQRLRE